MIGPNKSAMALVSLALAAGLLHGCGKATTEETTTGAQATMPSDSKGTAVAVGLQFVTEASTALALADTTLDLGNGVILSDARVNIAKIKIKPLEDEDDKEKSLKSEVETKGKEAKDRRGGKSDELEAQFAALKTKYKGLLDAASSNAEKDKIKLDFEKEKHVLESSIAAAKKASEDESDAVEIAKDGDIKWRGPYVYNLISGTMDKELPDVTLFDGSYRRIQFQLKANRSAESTDALLNNSVFVKGTVDIAGAATPFTFSLRQSEDLRVSSSDAMTMGADSKNPVLIAFQPKLWFANVDFTSAAKDALGIIVIDPETNIALFKAIRSNLKISTSCGKDVDKDGRLGSSERKGRGKDDAVDSSDDSSEVEDDSSRNGSGR
jgi:hypothetical protein